MNVLVFTNHYPFKNKDSTATKAVHYFTKEWVKEGHNVVVVHNYISLVSLLNTNSKEASCDSYIIDGVQVLYSPIKRYIPKSDFIMPNEVAKVRKRILKYLEKINFIPEKFVVHFCVEQWQIVEDIRKHLPCQPIPIFHNCDVKSIKKIKKITSTSKRVGYRSEKIKNIILEVVDHRLEMFQVFSGAPDYIYEMKTSLSQYEKDKVVKLLFVGNLIPLKKVDITIKALNKLKDKYNFEFNIIGSGKSKGSIMKLAKELDVEEKIIFHPRLKRNQIIKFMRNSDCFIMVSSPETLGIVYIEAMASGCFVIGSKGEGIDGIIRNKESGLLVKPNDIEALVIALDFYFSMDPKEKDKIIEKSIKLSNNYKESVVAKQYLIDLA